MSDDRLSRSARLVCAALGLMLQCRRTRSFSQFQALLFALLALQFSEPSWALDTFTQSLLAPGNQWVYRVTDNLGTSTVTRTVLPTMVTFNGTMAYQVSDSDGMLTYETRDAFLGLVESVFVPGYGTTTATATFSPPLSFPASDLNFGTPLTKTGTATLVYTNVTTLTVNYSITVTLVGTESVTVPAGTFLAMKATIAFSMAGYVNGTYVNISDSGTGWGLPGIGMIREVVTKPDGTTKTYELVSSNLLQAQGNINVNVGWNLVGNSSSTWIDVPTTFGDSTLVTTVWKWNPTTRKWAFYTPTLTDGGAAYAASSGYDVLTTIDGGEGFWVNATQPFSKPLPPGISVISSWFQDGRVAALKPGWNLISIANTATPFEFNVDVAWVPPLPGEQMPREITTLWAWDNASSKWYFYAPSLEAQGGTAVADYIASKGYLDFTANNKTLGRGVGFWVNKP